MLLETARPPAAPPRTLTAVRAERVARPRARAAGVMFALLPATMMIPREITLVPKYATQYNQMMAVALITLMPILVLFFIAQKTFIRGVTLTGISGR